MSAKGARRLPGFYWMRHVEMKDAGTRRICAACLYSHRVMCCEASSYFVNCLDCEKVSEAVQSSPLKAHHGRGCRCEECKIENYSLEVPQGAQSGDTAASVSDGGSQKAVERSTEQVLRELREKIEKCEPSLGGPRVAKLEAQLQAAGKDIERMNWLDSQMDWGNRPDGSLKHGIAAYLGAPKPIREAIDSAISATSKGDIPK